MFLDDVGSQPDTVDEVARHNAARAVGLGCQGAGIAVDLAHEGAQKRQEAEQELRRIEGELKQKLLETRKVSK